MIALELSCEALYIRWRSLTAMVYNHSRRPLRLGRSLLNFLNQERNVKLQSSCYLRVNPTSHLRAPFILDYQNYLERSWPYQKRNLTSRSELNIFKLEVAKETYCLTGSRCYWSFNIVVVDEDVELWTGRRFKCDLSGIWIDFTEDLPCENIAN